MLGTEAANKEPSDPAWSSVDQKFGFVMLTAR